MSTAVPSSTYFTTEFSKPLGLLEQQFIAKRVEIEKWFRAQWLKTPPSFYGSVDLRNSGFKLAPVDTNLFPAGFNNLNPQHMALYIQAAQATIAEICPNVTQLLLIPENHSRNLYYFENLATLVDILSRAGYEIRIGVLDKGLKEAHTIELNSGRTLKLEPLIRTGAQVTVENFAPCCILLNNDLSEGVPEILQNLDQMIIPSLKLGWSTRLKSEHFKFYEAVAEEFAALLNFDPWFINPLYDHCPAVNFMKKEGEDCLIKRSQALLKKIEKKYQEYDIKQTPFLAIKANAGTYGMAVMMIQDPAELARLNRKQRTHMSTTKGNKTVTKAIIQEGVYSFEKSPQDSSVAEPVVYLFGKYVIGGFYRVHKDRGIDENLNSPGMDFVPLAFDEPCLAPCSPSDIKSAHFYAYGVIARLAFLAAARELAVFTQP